MRVVILGAGKVGTALARALAQTRHPVELRNARARGAGGPIRAGLLVLAVRDADLAGWAERLASGAAIDPRTAVVHVAGALGPEVLAPLRGKVAGIGQAHPVVSFPSARARVELRGAAMVVQGEPLAVRRAMGMARAVGFVPCHPARLDRSGYHAACALAGNGAVALAATAADLLCAAGVAPSDVPRLLGPLLRSVADNITRLGIADALSGPIHRGDAGIVSAHVEGLLRLTPTSLPLYLALAARQVALAREGAGASAVELDAVERVLARARRQSRRA